MIVLEDVLKPGEVFTFQLTISDSDTADSIGNTGVRVFSTPALLMHVENTSSLWAARRLPEGYSPVGISVDLKHTGAVPVGGEVIITSRVLSVRRKVISYEFHASYQGREISHGTYQQAIIDLQEFLAKNNAM